MLSWVMYPAWAYTGHVNISEGCQGNELCSGIIVTECQQIDSGLAGHAHAQVAGAPVMFPVRTRGEGGGGCSIQR